MGDLPRGTVTFLFTDIEGSTRVWEESPDAMRLALEACGDGRAAIRSNPLQAAAPNWQHSAEDSSHYPHGLRLRRPPQDRQRHQESDGALWASCRSSAPPGGSATGQPHITFYFMNVIRFAISPRKS